MAGRLPRVTGDRCPLTAGRSTVTAATTRQVSVALSNPRDEPIRGVQASLSADDAGITITDDDTAPVIGGSETRTLTFDVRDAPAVFLPQK